MLSFAAFLAIQTSSDNLIIDPLIIIEAQEIWSVIGRPDNPVWPGWDARKTPILIYFPGKQDVLINHPKPPAGFKRYSGPIKSPIGEIWVKNGETIKMFDGQNTTVDVNGVRTLVVADTLSVRRQWVEGLAPNISANPDKADEIVLNSALFPNPYGTMTVVAHEAFHAYQEKLAPDKHGKELALTRYPALSPENNAAFAMESELLASALAAKSGQEVRKLAVEWLAMREWRRSLIGEEACRYEDGTEFSEGTATYVQYRTLQSLQGRTPAREMWLLQGFRGYSDLSEERAGLVAEMRSCMSGKKIINGDLYGASPVRFRLYYSGMGVSALLDCLGSRWHNRLLTTGDSLTDIAKDAIRATPGELSEALARMKSDPRFEAFMKEKTQLAKDGEVYIANEVAGFDKSLGELVLDYSKLDKPKVAFTFTPFGILRVDDSRRIYRLLPMRGMVGALTFAEDGPRPLLQDDQAKCVRLKLPEQPKEDAILGQIGASAASGGQFEAAELKLPGVTLKKVKGKISVSGRKVILQLSD